MADLIDREELLCALYQDCRCMNTRFLNCVRQAPTIEAEPVRHGLWILRSVQPDEYNNNFYECSICRATEKHNINVNVPYCWRCGAKMGDSEVETDTVARWEDAGINGTVKCSRCNFVDYFAKRDRVMLFGFCPGCGAKMDGGEKK